MRITLQRSYCLNALDRRSHFILAEAFDRFSRDNSHRIATITDSSSKTFCVGTDLKEREEAGRDDFPETSFAGLTQRLDFFKPEDALINRDAIERGLEIVLAFNLAIIVNQVCFSLPESRTVLTARGDCMGSAHPVKLNT